MSVDLATSVAGVRLPSPILAASGTAGYGVELDRYVDLRQIGAIVVKSLSAQPWAGNPSPRMHMAPAGMLNSVGLHNGGVHHWLEHHLPRLTRAGARVVASIWGFRAEDYAEAARVLDEAGPAVVALEVNLSCPNLGGGHQLFAQSAELTREVLDATAAFRRPRWAKLTPNVSDIVEIAAAAAEAGAAAVTLINTVGGLAVGAVGSVLGGPGGGLSGPAIHPVAVRAVWEVRKALPDLAIVGVGGVSRAADAVELMRAGADAVQVGTATFLDPRACARVQRQLVRWCRANGVRRVEDLKGDAQGRR
jgi:dihydroorotate dehydrogenase (NAD+) catalytic subunit